MWRCDKPSATDHALLSNKVHCTSGTLHFCAPIGLRKGKSFSGIVNPGFATKGPLTNMRCGSDC